MDILFFIKDFGSNFSHSLAIHEGEGIVKHANMVFMSDKITANCGYSVIREYTPTRFYKQAMYPYHSSRSSKVLILKLIKRRI